MTEDTPPALETKDLPGGYAPAPVPYTDAIGYEQDPADAATEGEPPAEGEPQGDATKATRKRATTSAKDG